MLAVDTHVLVRLLARDDTRQAAAADAAIAKGAWVSHLVLAEALRVLEAVYERTARQLIAALDLMLAQKAMALDAVVELSVDPDELVRRISLRSRESGRLDDNEDVVRKRLEVYVAQTSPLVDYYRGKGLLKTVDGMESVITVSAAIKHAVEG